jgi:hypothetical protein
MYQNKGGRVFCTFLGLDGMPLPRDEALTPLRELLLSMVVLLKSNLNHKQQSHNNPENGSVRSANDCYFLTRHNELPKRVLK